MLLHNNDGNNSGDGDDEGWLCGGLKDNDETVDIFDDDGWIIFFANDDSDDYECLLKVN